MLLGTIQKAPWVPTVYPTCNTMNPRRVQGPPFPDFFMKLMPLGGAHGPHPVPGRSQKYPKNMTKIDPETDAEKVLQKVSKSVKKYLQNRGQTDGKSMRFRNPRNLVFCEEYNL